jgi:hypothetical protein
VRQLEGLLVDPVGEQAYSVATSLMPASGRRRCDGDDPRNPTAQGSSSDGQTLSMAPLLERMVYGAFSRDRTATPLGGMSRRCGLGVVVHRFRF